MNGQNCEVVVIGAGAAGDDAVRGCLSDRPGGAAASAERTPAEPVRVFPQRQLQAAPFRVNDEAAPELPVWVACNPMVVEAPGASEAL
jgi:hypothetical protein